MKPYKALIAFALTTICAPIKAQTINISLSQTPVLIERDDNVMYRIRIETDKPQTLDCLTVAFDGGSEPIDQLKLYYAGIEGTELNGTVRMAPVEYISRNTPSNTLKANRSYSVLKDCQKVRKSRSVTLAAQQQMAVGVNYFWVSVKLNRRTRIDKTIDSKIGKLVIDGNECPFTLDSPESAVLYVGTGVRHAGDNGATAYRIPGLVTSNRGTLLAVYDVRYNSSKDLQEHIDIGLSRSTDCGQTWEKMRLPLSMGEEGGLPSAQNGIGDPSILVDRSTGTIWIVAAWAHAMGNRTCWWNSMPGMDKNHTAQLVMTRSDDDGRTWSAPINITEQVKKEEWYFLLQGPGRGITTADGTIVFPIQYIDSERIPNAGIMYSTDHGESWTIHSPARSNTTEAQVAQLPDGSLMLNMRDNRGGSRAVATTTDMGATWTEHPSSRSALREPVCMASLIAVAADDNVLGLPLLIFCNPDSDKNRNRMTIKVSTDNGITWHTENQIMIDEGEGWGYSCLSMIDSERVGVLYESSVAQMTFQTLSLKDLVKRIDR